MCVIQVRGKYPQRKVEIMGFFSTLCEECEVSIRSPYAVGTNSYQSKAVAITPEGKLWTGTYNGYGVIEGPLEGLEDGDEPNCITPDCTTWHEKCWEAAGKPISFQGPSAIAEDQGYFFDDEDE
jgi:hypothetical protein